MVDMPIEEFRAMVERHVAAYTASDGADGGLFNGWPCVVLTTLGARTTQLRHSPVIRVKLSEADSFAADPDAADDYVVVASMGGAPKHPSWYHNLVAHPENVELQDHALRRTYRATVIEPGAERDAMWAAAVAVYPPYLEYQQRTTRLIPVVRLTPNDSTNEVTQR